MTTALELDEWSAACLGRAVPPGRTWYPFYRRLGGPQGPSGRTENLAPLEFNPLTDQPIVIPRPTELPDHTSSVYTIKTNQLILLREIIDDLSDIHTKHKKKLSLNAYNFWVFKPSST